MLTPIEQFLMGKFNYYTEIAAAKSDRSIESAMVDKLLDDPTNQFNRIDLEDAVFDLIHIQQHYICDAPWLFDPRLG